MKSELLAKSPLLFLPLAALFLFLAIFTVMVVLAMRRRDDPAQRLPLDDGEEGAQR